MLILGGIVLLFIDRLPLRPALCRHHELPDARSISASACSRCLALVPGVSRSGATIVGAMLLGSEKRAAAEFSFFLAMPTMLGAFVYDLWKNIDVIDAGGAGIIAIGFVAAFISAVIVVRTFLGFVSRHGFAPVRLVADRGRDRRAGGGVLLLRPERGAGGDRAGNAGRHHAGGGPPEATEAAPQPAGDDALGDLIREQGQQ